MKGGQPGLLIWGNSMKLLVLALVGLTAACSTTGYARQSAPSERTEYRPIGSAEEEVVSQSEQCEPGTVVGRRDNGNIILCTGSGRRATGRECGTNPQTGERVCRPIRPQGS